MRGAVKVMAMVLGEAVRLQEWALGAKSGLDFRNWKATAEDEALRNAEKLRRWLEGRSDRKATIRETLQFGPYGLRKKKRLIDAVQVLREHGWLAGDCNRELKSVKEA